MTHQVYRFYDENGRLIYVGQAECAISRARDHRSQAPWFWRVDYWTIENCETKKYALMREAWAIRSESPMFNIEGRAEDHKDQVRLAYEAERERPPSKKRPIPIPMPHDPNDGSGEAFFQKIMKQRAELANELQIIETHRKQAGDLFFRMRRLVEQMQAMSLIHAVPSFGSTLGGDAA